MKFSPTITSDGRQVQVITISQGETLEIPIAWENADGTPRRMDTSAVSISVETYRVGEIVQVREAQRATYGAYTDEIGGVRRLLLLSHTASAALAPGLYRIRILETRSATEPDTVSAAEIAIRLCAPGDPRVG